MTDIVIASAARTPVGSFNGALHTDTPRMTSVRLPSRLPSNGQRSTGKKWTR